MTDPRNTDPRHQDRQFSDPVQRRDQSNDGMWGWIAGIAVVVLITFIVIIGWNSSGPQTASNAPARSPAATTTGQGSAAPPPMPSRSAPQPQDTAPAASSEDKAPNRNGGTQ